MELRDLVASRGAQRRVKVRKWLIKQEHLGIAHDGTAERDPLALAAGERVRSALHKLGEAERRRHVFYAAIDFPAVNAAAAQAEGEIFAHAHVWIEGIALEHHSDVAVLRGHRIDDAVVDGQPPG